jgi:hypothetical protein
MTVSDLLEQPCNKSDNHNAISSLLQVLFVETPRKFINLRGVSTNKTIICFIAIYANIQRTCYKLLTACSKQVTTAKNKLVDSL